jgi:ankyrin repeat protein
LSRPRSLISHEAGCRIRWGKNDAILTQPLHFVCDKVFDGTLSGERAAQLALVNAGARPDSRGLLGETALHWAAATGNVVLVQRLLECGAPVDAIDTKRDATAIGWALHGWDEPPPPGIHGQHREVVARLVRAGAVVDPEWLAEARARGCADVISALQGEL